MNILGILFLSILLGCGSSNVKRSEIGEGTDLSDITSSNQLKKNTQVPYQKFVSLSDFKKRRFLIFLDTDNDGKSDSLEIRNFFINFMRLTEDNVRRKDQKYWKVMKFSYDTNFDQLENNEEVLLNALLSLRK